jgi:glucose-1-phosphate cytidylyltransferase
VKTVILAGGLGTRLMEETVVRPKPMVEIGGRPILWHIMRLYAAQGFGDFIVAAGYKGEMIKHYFLNYRLFSGDLHLDFATGAIETRDDCDVDWRVEVVDTGSATQTGGRIKRLAPQLGNERFFATYGDGLADLDIGELLDFHRRHGRIATVTAIRAPIESRPLPCQSVDLPTGAASNWVNGGFFVFEPEVFDYIDGDADALEQTALVKLARDGELMAYRHEGFWQCMDTLEERRLLEGLWASGLAPWARVRGLTPAMD